MKTISIDINADVGEGIGNEFQLLPLISSCNIACGGHVGDEESMKTIVRLAKQHKVKIGAHPSFPDRKNFGREMMQISHTALYHSIKNQIETLSNIARKEQVLLNHVKPHGALYNLALKDKSTAEVVVEVMKRFHQPFKLFVPYGSVIADIAQQEQIKIVYEAFADRNYNEDLSLVSRNEENALILNSDDVFSHVYNMIINKKVKTISGVEVAIKVDTFCIHGDNPKVLKLALDLKQKLETEGIQII